MSTSLAFRCPDDLAALIKSQVELTNQDKTSVVVSMLRSSLPSVKVTACNKLPEVVAVYFVWSLDRLLYIGGSKNLKRRFYSHHRITQFLEAGEETRISWFEVNPQDLPVIESSLLEMLDTDLNGESVVASPSGLVPITFRCPDDIAAHIQSRVEATGKDRTTVIVELLKQSCGLVEDSQSLNNESIFNNSVEPVLDERITQLLDERMTQITSQLAAFEERLGKLKAR